MSYPSLYVSKQTSQFYYATNVDAIVDVEVVDDVEVVEEDISLGCDNNCWNWSWNYKKQKL